MPPFKLTGLSLSARISANGIPESVLSKLEHLKDKMFTTEEAFFAEVAKTLSPDELLRHRTELRNRADVEPRFVLEFTGAKKPELWKTEFYHRDFAPGGRRTARGKDEGAYEADGSFQWTAAVK
ncbi:MAG TPA: hypothetical protein VKD72_32540, partial [Gemmataceae bacterium]|nr:hypothetical protein [Gemmataceae bacterium]